MINKGLMTSDTPEWETPQWFFDELNSEHAFTLDPCCTKDTAKCEKFYTKEQDGLKQSWVGERVFMNPPYGRSIVDWMHKAYFSGAEVVVCLIPARTDTRWWHQYAMEGDVRFLLGRLKFSNSKNSAPFPSAVVTFRNNFTEKDLEL